MDPKTSPPDIEPLIPRDGLTRLPQSDWLLGTLLFVIGVGIVILILCLLRRIDRRGL
jgi:hypothetical protein